ncbi:MAG: phage tail protein [Bdellovibrionales bacterium]
MADPYLGYRFRVEIDKIVVAAFSEATTPDSSSDVVEYREGKDLPKLKKIAGLTKYGNITLKRGMTDNMELYNWRKIIEEHGTNSPDSRRSISLLVVDDTGQEKARWNIFEAWPVKYDATDFNAKNSEVLLETVELAHEGFTRIQ